MICEFGDIAIVPFPFVDRTVTKFRPALVLSSGSFNEANENTILAMITTAGQSSWPSDIVIRETKAAGLAHACFIRWKVFTLPNDLVARMAGRLAEADRVAAKAGLKALLP